MVEHFDLLTIRPVVKVGLEQLRAVIGGGSLMYHSEEISGTEPCAEDQPYLDAYEARARK